MMSDHDKIIKCFTYFFMNHVYFIVIIMMMKSIMMWLANYCIGLTSDTEILLSMQVSL